MRALHPAAHRAVRLSRGVLIAVLALTALALAACVPAEQSVNVDQSRIWTAYELQYDANTDLTVARASFRFGSSLGTPLELTSPSEVRFNGELLSRSAEMGTGMVRYERTLAGQVSGGTFRFVDTEDEAYSNTVTLRPIAFPATLGSIDNDASHAFEWVGPVISGNEQVVGTLRRFGSGEPELGAFLQTEAGSRTMIINASMLRDVSPGDVTLTMTRTWNGTPSRAPDAGGKLTLKAVARNARATIVD